MEKTKFSKIANRSVLQCPSCGSADVSESWVADKFQYGEGVHAVELVANVPLCACANCGMQYTDERAEKIRHELVCQHLRILGPEEVCAIRERYGITQSDFAEITQIGRASLVRWESGASFQNGSIDSLLYLLGFKENMERLSARHKVQEVAPSQSHNVVRSKFRCIDANDSILLMRESKSFLLHPEH